MTTVAKPHGPAWLAQLTTGQRFASVVPAATTATALVVAVAAWEILTGLHSRFIGLSAVVAFLALGGRGVFRTTMVPDLASRIARVVSTAGLGVVTSLSALFLFSVVRVEADGFLIGFVLIALSSIVGLGAGLSLLRGLWSKGYLRSRALVVGSGQLSHEIAVEIELRQNYGVDVVGFLTPFEDSQIRPIVSPILGTHRDVEKVVADTRADRIILPPAGPQDAALVRVARWANAAGIPVFIVPRLFELGVGLDSLSPDRVRGYPLVRLQRSAHPRLGLLLKRVFDIVFSAVGLLLNAPVILLAALMVRLTSAGPAFFGQERVGRHGTFTVWKLRSMRHDDSIEHAWTAGDRVTPVGAFLRRTAIDELPQLWNILSGDMSFVGPRPERPEFVAKFSSAFPDYNDRLRMPPGLTGLSQIVGLRGDTSIAERLKYDNLYIDQWSFSGDMQILVKTLWALLRSSSYEQRQRQLHTAISEASSSVVAIESPSAETIPAVVEPRSAANGDYSPARVIEATDVP